MPEEIRYVGSSTWRPNPDRTRSGNLESTITFDGVEFTSIYVSTAINDAVYEITLRPHTGGVSVAGEWTAMHNPDRKGLCSAKVFRSRDGEILLMGAWLEDGMNYDWIVFLKERHSRVPPRV